MAAFLVYGPENKGRVDCLFQYHQRIPSWSMSYRRHHLYLASIEGLQVAGEAHRANEGGTRRG